MSLKLKLSCFTACSCIELFILTLHVSFWMTSLSLDVPNNYTANIDLHESCYFVVESSFSRNNSYKKKKGEFQDLQKWSFRWHLYCFDREVYYSCRNIFIGVFRSYSKRFVWCDLKRKLKLSSGTPLPFLIASIPATPDAFACTLVRYKMLNI